MPTTTLDAQIVEAARLARAEIRAMLGQLDLDALTPAALAGLRSSAQADGMMTAVRIGLATAAALAIVAAAPGTAHADPTPPPSPGYQIPGPNGPEFPGAQVYPPYCLRNMLACGFRYDPDTGTWQSSGGNAVP